MGMTSVYYMILVTIAYFLMLIWLPSFAFFPLVKDRPIMERAVVYLILGNLILINLVFLLGYLKIMQRTAVISSYMILILIIRLFVYRQNFFPDWKKKRDQILHLASGELKFKLWTRQSMVQIKHAILSKCKELFRGRILEWILVGLVLAYTIYFYGYHAFVHASYGAPDEEVHLYWIQELLGGHIFISGVYPFGFHNIIAALSVAFRLNPGMVIHVFGVLQTILIVVLLYWGMRKVSRVKYAPLLGIVVFILCDFFVDTAVYRYQFAIPQEYAMIMLIPMMVFFFQYIEERKKYQLICFAISLGLTLSIHFYDTIIAAFLCIALGLVYFKRMVLKKVLIKVIVAGICGLLAAVIPLGIGIALGHPLEQSMSWAMSVIQGTPAKTTVVRYDPKTESENASQESEETKEEKEEEKLPMPERLRQYFEKFVFEETRGLYFFLVLIGLDILLSLIGMIFLREKEMYQRYMAVQIFICFLLLLIILKPLGLPALMEAKRVAIFFAYFVNIEFLIPIDFVGSLWTHSTKAARLCSAFVLSGIGALIVFSIKNDFYRERQEFYYFETDGIAKTIYNIQSKYEKNTWTVVSPVNEYSLIVNSGFHYELDQFLLEQENWKDTTKIFIPTKYVFVLVEKMPIIKYGHPFYYDDPLLKQREEIQYKYLKEPLDYNKVDNFYYQFDRNILMTKAYYWAQKYQEAFPKEMSIYYEDEEIIIYRIIQDEYRLNNLAIDYLPHDD